MIEFKADKINIRGPRIDGSYVITFEVGEYEQKKVAQMMLIPQQTMVNVKVDIKKAK